MRKNRMMRAASVLLVLTLLTTCMISATFAKYTTEASGEDAARVAKWGVEVGSSGSLFDVQYATDDTTAAGITYSVISSAAPQDNLVAPGTKNGDGITFTIKGTPEVAVEVAVDVTAEDDVFLAAGTYANLTDGDNATATFDLANAYYPVVYTLADGKGTKLAEGNLAAIETYLEALSGKYAPNTDLATTLGTNTNKSADGTYTLTWAWAFDDNNGANDPADTLLGSLAANPNIEAKSGATGFVALTDGTDFNLDTSVKVEIRVTQID